MGENPCMDVRQTLMALGRMWDAGMSGALMQDEAGSRGMILRIASVCRLDERTPVFILLYYPRTREGAASVVRPWMREHEELAPGEGGISTIKATATEQTFLQTLLEHNSRFLSSGYKAQKRANVAKLNSDPGCRVCGKKTVSRCSSCQTTTYCSEECQKLDWPSHKAIYKPLKGGTWCTIPIDSGRALAVQNQDGRYMSAATINRFDLSSDLRTNPRVVNMDMESEDTPWANVHGDKVFLIKLQVQLSQDGMPVHAPDNTMIYDRQRSLHGYFVRTQAPDVFDEVNAEMRGPRGGHHGLKMYRYARRVGDRALSICLDREPKEAIKW